MTAGYSGTPLKKKLGLKEEFTIRLIDVPPYYFELIETPQAHLKITKSGKVDFIHIFYSKKVGFTDVLTTLSREIEKDGMIWVSWEKKKAKQNDQLNENFVRETALSIGLVDTKVCAVDDTWSGLKLVWRKELR